MEYPHTSIVSELSSDIDHISSLLSISESDLAERIKPYWIELTPREPPEDIYIVGVDGSINDTTVFGGLRLYVITAASVKHPSELIGYMATALIAYDVPRAHTAASMLMTLMETLLALRALREGADMILVDGTLRAVFNSVSGEISGMHERLRTYVDQVLGNYDRSLQAKINPELSQCVNEGLLNAYRHLRGSIDFIVGDIDERTFKRKLRRSETFNEFASTVTRWVEKYTGADEARGFHDLLQDDRYRLEPLVNGIIFYMLYVETLYEIFQALKESDTILVGASKRVIWPTLDTDIYIKPEHKEVLGRAILRSNQLRAPGMLKVRSKYIHKPLIDYLKGFIYHLDAVSKYFQGEKIKYSTFVFKPSNMSLLRIEYYSGRPDVTDKYIGELLAEMIFPGAGSSANTPSFIAIEYAHNYCSVSNEFVNKLADVLRLRIFR